MTADAPVIVEVRDLVKRYPGAVEPALKGLNLTIRRGEFYGLLGPNGAGKTTFIGLLCGLLAPDAGEVCLRGRNVFRHPSAIRGQLGLVPQNIALYPSLSARENLHFFGSLLGLAGPELSRRAEDWLGRVGLTHQADRRISQYSGGMKRRANLVAGLLHEPALLVLDEPTVGIDPQSRLLIHENLKRLNQEGVTILCTTHYLNEAEQLCTRLAVLDSGTLVVEGSPAGLVAAHEGCATLEDVFIRMTGRGMRD